MHSILKNHQKWQKNIVQLALNATSKTRNPTFEKTGVHHYNNFPNFTLFFRQQQQHHPEFHGVHLGTPQPTDKDRKRNSRSNSKSSSQSSPSYGCTVKGAIIIIINNIIIINYVI